MKGKLIVIEGTDCSGKQTQSKLLADKLNQLGYRAVCLSFPMYNTPTGRIVGGCYLGKPEIGESYFPEGSVGVDPKIASLYYAADRKYNIGKIKQYIEDGYFVILDRYTSSNMAHQGCKVLDKEERFNVFQFIDKLEYWLLDLPKADITFLLHVPSEVSQELMKNREFIDGHEKDPDYLKNAELTYLELSELYNWKRIDCVEFGKMKPIDQIHEEILFLLLNSSNR